MIFLAKIISTIHNMYLKYLTDFEIHHSYVHRTLFMYSESQIPSENNFAISTTIIYHCF